MSRRPIVVRIEVETDLDQAASWYDEKRVGLGDEFLLSVEAALGAIRERPHSFPMLAAVLGVHY